MYPECVELSPGRIHTSYLHHFDTHVHTDPDWVGCSNPSPKHIFVLDVFPESLHGDYKCSLTKLGICFKL